MTDSHEVRLKPVVLILGATGSIGSALARRLAERDSKLILAARDEKKLNDLASEYSALALPADGTSSEQVDALFDRAMSEYGRVDGVVNLVGSITLKPCHLLSDEQWHETISLNMTSVFYVVRAATRAMMKTGGSIVLTSSVAATIGLINHDAIGAAKAGVEGLTRSAAATYAPRGIRVNAVSPSLTRSNMSAPIFKNEASLNASIAMHPLKRAGEPEDIASAIDWLLDPAQSWVTGQVIRVDGGLSRVKARGGS